MQRSARTWAALATVKALTSDVDSIPPGLGRGLMAFNGALKGVRYMQERHARPGTA
ncbi:MAG: hypothetical protein AAFS10_00055 [Myxococcota bacterium]